MRVDVPDERSQPGAGPIRGEEAVPSAPYTPAQSSPPASARPASSRPQSPSTKKDHEPTEEINPVVSFLEGHYLIGLFLVRQWPRWEKLLCLMTVLMSELFFLGVFYYYVQNSTDAGPESSDSYLWSDYFGEDALFYLYSFLLSFVISALAATLFNVGEMQANRQRRLTFVGAGVAVCVIVLVLFVILISIMNSQMCYEYAGRWCIGFLWCVFTELFALESLRRDALFCCGLVRRNGR